MFVLIMVVGWTGWRLFGLVAWGSRPLWLAGAAADAGLKVLTETSKTRSTLISENRALSEENQKLKAQLLSDQAELTKWQALEKAWGRLTTEVGGVAALVISQPNRSPYDTLIIDIGTKNSERTLSAGMTVASDGVLLGKLARVNAYTSQVRLYSAPGEELNVLIGESRVPALAVGRGGGNFSISLPRSVIIKPGDVVAAPTTTPSLLGVVGAVDNNPKNPFQTILFRSPLNIFELPAVIVL